MSVFLIAKNNETVNKIISRHICNMYFDMLQTRISLLIDLGIDFFYCRNWIVIKAVSTRASSVTSPVETVNSK